MDGLSAQRHDSRRDRVAASSVWMRGLLVVVVAGPWVLTIHPALSGDGSVDLLPLGVMVGAFVGNSVRDRAFLRLPAASRREVIAVQRSGQWSGDRALDALALQRVERAARGARSDRILLPVLLALYVAGPVIAAVRDSPWWLVCLLPGAVVAVAIPATWPEDPRLQRDRLLRPVATA